MLPIPADPWTPGGTALAVGTVINGRYVVQDVLGQGGMGWVYAVRDAVWPERSVALKVVYGLARSPELTALFEAEFRTMSRLRHPNLAQVYDFEQIHGTAHGAIAMERIIGRPIHRALADSLDWRPVVDAVVQVSRALSYVHSRKILHGDLKPSNILVESDGLVRLIDFGIAREWGDERSKFRGTPLYTAPEVLVGSGTDDHRADLYSLGVTMYELLVGVRPRLFGGPDEIAARVRAHQVELPVDCDVPEWLRDVVRTLCSPDPADRYRSANALIEAINVGSDLSFEPETVETRRSYVLTPRFAGRRAELDRVMDFVEERLHGVGTAPMLLVHGESGIGKSRLLREARQRVQLRRSVFIEANCYEVSPTEYGPIATLLEQLVPLMEQHGESAAVQRALPELTRIAPRLARERETAPPRFTTAAQDEQARMLETISGFMIDAARVVPYVAYVNDLQWAGHGPAQLLAYLAERVRDDEDRTRTVPIALIGSYRLEETAGRPVGTMVRRLLGTAAAELPLRPLETDAVRDIIASMLGLERVPRSFLAGLVEATGGNPFFVQELMRMLIEDGTVYLEGGRWATAAELGEYSLPTTISDAFRRRFALLTPDQQDMMRALAVQARPMPEGLLAAVLGDHRSVQALGRELARRGLVEIGEGSRPDYAISHDRMRQTVYEDLGRVERRRWHRRIGELLEAYHSVHDREMPEEELAHHFWHAYVPEKALFYAIPAGERSAARYANQAALGHFEHAIRLLDDIDERRTRVLERRADIMVRLADYEGALAAYRELLGCIEGGGLAEARLYGKIADIHLQRSEFRWAAECGWRALATWGERRPTSPIGWGVGAVVLFIAFALERVGLYKPRRDEAHLTEKVAAYNRVGLAYYFSDPRRAFYCTFRLWRIAGECSDRESMAATKSGLAVMLGAVGLRRWAVQLIDEAYRDAVAAGSRWWMGAAEARRGMVLRSLGRWEPERLDRAVETLREAGNMLDLSNAVYHAADACMYRGDIDGAYDRARAHNALTARLETGVPPTARAVRSVEAQCSFLRGRLDERYFREVLAIGFETTDLLSIATGSSDWGEALTRAGRIEEGLEKLEIAHGIRNEESLIDGYSAAVLHTLPRAYLELGALDGIRTSRLRRVHAEAMRSTRRMHKQWRSPVLVNEALLRERAGRSKRADRVFAEAIEVARRQGAGLFVSLALFEWGRVLQERGDPVRAVPLLEEALDIARTGGNRWLEEKCERSISMAAVANRRCG